MNKERDTMEWIAIVIIGVILGNLSVQMLFRFFPQLSLIVGSIALVITILILYIAISLSLKK